jgi:hypothetical protein
MPSKYTVYSTFGVTGNGPIFAIRTPATGCQFVSVIVNSYTFPSDSMTVPRGPFAVSAAARVG